MREKHPTLKVIRKTISSAPLTRCRHRVEYVLYVVGLQYTLSRLVEAREIGQIGHIPTPNHCDTALTLHNVLQVHNVIRMFDVQMYCQT